MTRRSLRRTFVLWLTLSLAGLIPLAAAMIYGLVLTPALDLLDRSLTDTAVALSQIMEDRQGQITLPLNAPIACAGSPRGSTGCASTAKSGSTAVCTASASLPRRALACGISCRRNGRGRRSRGRRAHKKPPVRANASTAQGDKQNRQNNDNALDLGGLFGIFSLPFRQSLGFFFFGRHTYSTGIVGS